MGAGAKRTAVFLKTGDKMEKTGVNRRNRKIVSASSKGDSAEPQVRSQQGLGNSSKGYGVQEISINCLPPSPFISLMHIH